MQLHIFSLSQEVLELILRKNRVLLKKGCFIGPQNQRFRLKKAGYFFFVITPRKGGVLQTWVRAWYTLWSGGATSAWRMQSCLCMSSWRQVDPALLHAP